MEKTKIELPGNNQIYLVDGSEVRKTYLTDFIAGGHDLVYDFIPKNEIWIDDGTTKDEWIYTLLHELIERFFMEEDKINYDEAHNIANKFEHFYRIFDNKVELEKFIKLLLSI